MKRLLRLLNSRKFAVYLLLILLAALVLSTFLPSEITVTEEKWLSIQQEKPTVYWLATHFSTPYLVRQPVFLILSLFLFLSTLTCTLNRLNRWIHTRKLEFEKEKAFSFAVDETVAGPPDPSKRKLLGSLRRRHWKCTESEEADRLIVEAQKGSGMGFWGSIVFHAGLIICFLAVPATALTVFRGHFIVTEDVAIPLKQGFTYHEGKPLALLPDVTLSVHDLRGVYHEGIHKVEFGGRMNVQGRDLAFSVNDPAFVEDYQFTLYEFGNSVQLVIQKDEKELFNYFLNLRHPRKGDYFNLSSEGLQVFAVFFPDFIREGNRIASKSKEPNNPVLLIKLFRGSDEVAKGLINLGESIQIGDYHVRFGELRNWVNFIVVKELGVPVLAIGMVIGLGGLFVRFLSNERRLEVVMQGKPTGSSITLKGYSRYYPAFLEKEVREMADHIRGGE